MTREQSWFGQPRGLTVLFLTNMWEQFSYFGMRALLVYYMTSTMLFGQEKASSIYGFYTAFAYFTPIIGGERALSRSFWNCVPARYKRKFQIEIALNFFVKRGGGRMGFTLVPGLIHVIKERKRGLWLGLYQRLSMCADIVIIAFRLYVIFNLVTALGILRPAETPVPAIDQGQQ